MPKLTIYVPSDLETAVRRLGISASSICQRALRDEVRRLEGTTRTMLARYFREQSAWRLRVADDYLDDPRNRQCAEALQRLAFLVDQMPLDDEVFRALGALQRDADFDVISPSKEAGALAARYGFNGPSPTDEEGEDFIREWMKVFVREWFKELIVEGDDFSHIRGLGTQVMSPEELEALISGTV
jgi:hypothetical protein